jgi:hypothetical protein
VEVRELIVKGIGDIYLACHAPELSIGAMLGEGLNCGDVIDV